MQSTVASVFGHALVRRRRKPTRRRIAIGCRGRFVEIEIRWSKLAPFQRRERTRKPTIWDEIIRGEADMVGTGKWQMVVLSPEATAFMNTPAKVDMMPMIDDIYSVNVPGKRWCWFVVYTAPKLERRVCRDADGRGLSSYTPESKDWRKQSTRDKHQKSPKVEVVRPLFTRYAFVRLPAREVKLEKGGVRLMEIPFGVLSTIEGVQELVGTCDGPVMVPDDIVAKIRAKQERGEFDKTKQVGKKNTIAPKWMNNGVEVVVKQGPFATFMAMIEEILPNDRIRVELSIFGRVSRVELGLDQVSRVG